VVVGCGRRRCGGCGCGLDDEESDLKKPEEFEGVIYRGPCNHKRKWNSPMGCGSVRCKGHQGRWSRVALWQGGAEGGGGD
jgi:hypothetical protein